MKRSRRSLGIAPNKYCKYCIYSPPPPPPPGTRRRLPNSVRVCAPESRSVGLSLLRECRHDDCMLARALQLMITNNTRPKFATTHCFPATSRTRSLLPQILFRRSRLHVYSPTYCTRPATPADYPTTPASGRLTTLAKFSVIFPRSTSARPCSRWSRTDEIHAVPAQYRFCLESPC